MDDEQEEKREIEEYLNEHHLQAYLNDAVNDIVKKRPSDPLSKLADALRACSDASRQIQKVRGREILNGESLPALEVEIQIGQGSVYAAVSSGPFDNDMERHGGRGMCQAVENVDHILAEVLLEKDPTLQPKIDKILISESALASNVVTAASIACCKAGAKLSLTSLSDHIGIMCNNPEGSIPSIAFSIINGGHLSASPLWVQDIFIVPNAGVVTISERLLMVSAIHRTLEIAVRDVGQELLHRGPRGGFCNNSGTFEQLMNCLIVSLETTGFLRNVDIIVDVHASRLVPPRESGKERTHVEKEKITYNLMTFAADKRFTELISAQDLHKIYVEWLEKYPITAFIEPFDAADVAASKELLIQGKQILQGKAAASGKVPRASIVSTTVEQAPNDIGAVNGSEVDNSSLFRIIADESVSTAAQLAFMNEEQGANAVMINIPKITTVSETITFGTRASELGWSVVIAAVSEEELEGEFLAEFSVGLNAEQLLMGGLRSASAVAACTRLSREEDGGVKHISGLDTSRQSNRVPGNAPSAIK